MFQLGYTLSSEEHDPLSLLQFAKTAEDSGFAFLGISDHYHPWIDEQGQSPFVWNVIGALSQITKIINVFVEVNCPILRYHPAIVAQAAATSQYMLQGRFILGVGTGENLNEHIVGKMWPPIQIRQEMLKEAIEIMKLLWQGGYQSYFGQYFTLDSARIYTLPDNSIPLIFSAFGVDSAQMAGVLGDGLVTTKPSSSLLQIFKNNGGRGKPIYGQLSVCYDKSEQKAKELMKKLWPIAGMPSPLNTELRLPKDFEATSQLVSIEEATKNIPVGPDPEKILKSIQKYHQAGFDHIYIHNIGPNQIEFLKFAQKNIIPHLQAKNLTKSNDNSSSSLNRKQAISKEIGYVHQIQNKKT